MSGYIDATIFVTVSAISFVFMSDLLITLNPMVGLFIMSGIAIICFNLVGLKQIKSAYTTCLHHKLLYLIMSAALGLDWISVVYASTLSDPFISDATLFITLSTIGFLKLLILTKKKYNLLSIILLLGGLATLYFSYKIQLSQHLNYGIILGAVAGVLLYIYIECSHSMSSRYNLSSIQILCTRLWILFIGSSFFITWHEVVSAVHHYLLSLILISIASLVIPNYFNQQAIKKLGAAHTAVCISFVSPVTYVAYALIHHDFTLRNSMVCLIVSVALLIPNIMRLHYSLLKIKLS